MLLAGLLLAFVRNISGYFFESFTDTAAPLKLLVVCDPGIANGLILLY